MDDNRLWITEEPNSRRVAEDYFQRIFSTSHSSNMDEILEVVDKVVTDGMN